MLERAEGVITKLRDSYLGWVKNDLETLNHLWDEAQLCAIPQRNDVLSRLFSVAHDVKGQGGSFGFDLVSALADQLCRFLEHHTIWSDDLLAVIKQYLLALHHVIEAQWMGDGGIEGAALTASLAEAEKAIFTKTNHNN